VNAFSLEPGSIRREFSKTPGRFGGPAAALSMRGRAKGNFVGLAVGTICSSSCSIILAPAFPSYSRYGYRIVWAHRPSRLKLQGKGRKHRTLPLWRQTQRLLRQWIRENRLSPSMPLLPNRYGEALTRFGAFQQIKKLVQQASVKLPNLGRRPISPHLFQTRHRYAHAGDRSDSRSDRSLAWS
jgi:hypothetical protein